MSGEIDWKAWNKALNTLFEQRRACVKDVVKTLYQLQDEKMKYDSWGAASNSDCIATAIFNGYHQLVPLLLANGFNFETIGNEAFVSLVRGTLLRTPAGALQFHEDAMRTFQTFDRAKQDEILKIAAEADFPRVSIEFFEHSHLSNGRLLGLQYATHFLGATAGCLGLSLHVLDKIKLNYKAECPYIVKVMLRNAVVAKHSLGKKLNFLNHLYPLMLNEPKGPRLDVFRLVSYSGSAQLLDCLIELDPGLYRDDAEEEAVKTAVRSFLLNAVRMGDHKMLQVLLHRFGANYFLRDNPDAERYAVEAFCQNSVEVVNLLKDNGFPLNRVFESPQQCLQLLACPTLLLRKLQGNYLHNSLSRRAQVLKAFLDLPVGPLVLNHKMTNAGGEEVSYLIFLVENYCYQAVDVLLTRGAKFTEDELARLVAMRGYAADIVRYAGITLKNVNYANLCNRSGFSVSELMRMGFTVPESVPSDRVEKFASDWLIERGLFKRIHTLALYKQLNDRQLVSKQFGKAANGSELPVDQETRAGKLALLLAHRRFARMNEDTAVEPFGRAVAAFT